MSMHGYNIRKIPLSGKRGQLFVFYKENSPILFKPPRKPPRKMASIIDEGYGCNFGTLEKAGLVSLKNRDELTQLSNTCERGIEIDAVRSLISEKINPDGKDKIIVGSTWIGMPGREVGHAPDTPDPSFFVDRPAEHIIKDRMHITDRNFPKGLYVGICFIFFGIITSEGTEENWAHAVNFCIDFEDILEPSYYFFDSQAPVQKKANTIRELLTNNGNTEIQSVKGLLCVTSLNNGKRKSQTYREPVDTQDTDSYKAIHGSYKPIHGSSSGSATAAPHDEEKMDTFSGGRILAKHKTKHSHSKYKKRCKTKRRCTKRAA